MRRVIGTAIAQACRLALRVGLGLRLPAARIRQHDLIKNREFAAAKLRDAMDASVHWMGEVHRLDREIAVANAFAEALRRKRQSLSVPSPTAPIGDL